MASGADEAIAYDALVADGNPDDWPKVLSLQMRLRSIGSIVTMTIGALIYDPSAVNRLLAWLGTSLTLDQQITMRFPIYLTLVLAVLATHHRFQNDGSKKRCSEGNGFKTMAAFKMTWNAGKWIAQTPFAMAIILFGMCYDHILRMIVTMTSQYYRQIQLPEASFGVIGSAIALLGLLIPKIAEYMVEKNSANCQYVLGHRHQPHRTFRPYRFFPLLGTAAHGTDLYCHDVRLVFHQSLPQSNYCISPASHGAQLQRNGLQSGLRADWLFLCSA